VFKSYEEEAQLAKWAKFWSGVFKYGPLIAGSLDEAFNLLSYSADLGPSAPEEAAAVRAQLVPILSPLSPGQLSHVDLSILNTSGLPDYFPEPLPTVEVGGTRPGPIAAPFALATPIGIPGALEPGGLPGISVSPRPAIAPLVGLAPTVGRAPFAGLSPLAAAATGLAPQFGLPPKLIQPTDILPGGLPLKLPALARAPAGLTAAADFPGTEPQGGTKPSSTDCQGVGQKQKTKQQKKKKRNVCYRGIYYERASGLTKFRRERITCR
jgi:hypothetical protein